MTTQQLIAIVVLVLVGVFAIVALLLAGAWLYFRGSSRISPMPQLPSLPKREPKIPLPEQACPKCSHKKRWELSADHSQWTCTPGKCNYPLPGPKPRLKS